MEWGKGSEVGPRIREAKTKRPKYLVLQIIETNMFDQRRVFAEQTHVAIQELPVFHLGDEVPEIVFDRPYHVLEIAIQRCPVCISCCAISY